MTIILIILSWYLIGLIGALLIIKYLSKTTLRALTSEDIIIIAIGSILGPIFIAIGLNVVLNKK